MKGMDDPAPTAHFWRLFSPGGGGDDALSSPPIVIRGNPDRPIPRSDAFVRTAWHGTGWMLHHERPAWWAAHDLPSLPQAGPVSLLGPRVEGLAACSMPRQALEAQHHRITRSPDSRARRAPDPDARAEDARRAQGVCGASVVHGRRAKGGLPRMGGGRGGRERRDGMKVLVGGGRNDGLLVRRTGRHAVRSAVLCPIPRCPSHLPRHRWTSL